jgi:hypothetical protein
LDDLRRLLGSRTEDFDLHAWFFELDATAAKTGQVIPQRDGGKWLQARTLEEALRRGFVVAEERAKRTVPDVGSIRHDWECPHVPPCTEGRWRCQQRSDLDEARRRA